ncbi:MAG: prepilin-type N-terminal cleavage/methylation domain-containing protein [Candidatus Gracilibacteria bacterium]|nr:prepilin-type N-terminal cleavage/methylation domain-containing protein [Candidatus Gracilibacteria bacterium]
MKKSNKAFSIIEIIISTVILTIGVFGVYKLIGNNMSLLSNNEIFLQQNMLFNPFKECLKAIGYNSLSGSYSVGSGFSVNFGNDNLGCFTGSFDSNYSFSGVITDK